MELARLIEKITIEVLKQLRIEEKVKLSQQQRILVWTEACEVKEQLVAKLKLPLEQVEDRSQFKGLGDLENYHAIIFPRLGIGEMVHIVLGIQLGETETVISKALLLGKKTFVLREGLDYRDREATANPNYYKLLQDYEAKLSTFGISLVNLEELQLSGEVDQGQRQEGKEKTYSIKKRLITESQLEELFLKGYREIEVMKNAMITPLASDFIKSKQLKIIRRMEGWEKGSNL